MEWRTSREGSPIKAKVVKSAGKVMLTLFWDAEGWIHTDWLPPKKTITGAYYSNVLTELRESIKAKRRGKISKGILMLHDNAPSHTAHVTVDTLTKLKFELLPHPAYSPDLAPSDFHVFRKLKSDMKGKRFNDDEEVKAAVMTWLDEQTLNFWKEGILKCQERWEKCISIDGDYVEK